jgi:hypothetical protein
MLTEPLRLSNHGVDPGERSDGVSRTGACAVATALGRQIFFLLRLLVVVRVLEEAGRPAREREGPHLHRQPFRVVPRIEVPARKMSAKSASPAACW